MGHTPYGYKIENGKAIIDPVASVKLGLLFKTYLNGDALGAAAKKAGINTPHSSIGRMLKNKHYLGDDYYPSIIERDVYEAAQQERIKRAEKLGRIREPKQSEKITYPTVFQMSKSDKQFDDPFEQAEYAYSLLEIEGNPDGCE